MLFQIISFLLDVAVGLLAGACLLRLYMQYQRIPFGNPVGRLVFALTDWLVLPLRRVLPAVGRWDTTSLAGAFLLKLAQMAILWALRGAAAPVALVVLQAVFGVAQLVVTGLIALLIIYAILSWVQQGGPSPLYDVLDRLCAPVLRPLRRVIPLVGGFDLSPLALLVLLQVALIVLGHLQARAMSWVAWG